MRFNKSESDPFQGVVCLYTLWHLDGYLLDITPHFLAGGYLRLQGWQVKDNRVHRVALKRPVFASVSADSQDTQRCKTAPEPITHSIFRLEGWYVSHFGDTLNPLIRSGILVATDKGKPIARWGRKATGPSGTAELPPCYEITTN